MSITEDQLVAAIELERLVVQQLGPPSFDVGKAETVERRAIAQAVSKMRLDALQSLLHTARISNSIITKSD